MPNSPSPFLCFLTLVCSPDLTGCRFQSTEDIVEEGATRFAIYIMAIASFPELLQVIGVFYDLLNQNIKHYKLGWDI